MNLNESLPPVPPLPVDIAGVLTLIADAKGSERRLRELVASTEQANRAVAQAHAAIAKLEAERVAIETRRAEADYAMARDRAGLEKQRAALAAQAQELDALRERLDHQREYGVMLQREAGELGREIAAFEAKYAA